jgi:hypothetical protein
MRLVAQFTAATKPYACLNLSTFYLREASLLPLLTLEELKKL